MAKQYIIRHGNCGITPNKCKNPAFVCIIYVYSGSQSIVLVYFAIVTSTSLNVDSYSKLLATSVALNSKHAWFHCPALKKQYKYMLRDKTTLMLSSTYRFIEAQSFKYIPIYSKELKSVAHLNKKDEMLFCWNDQCFI